MGKITEKNGISIIHGIFSDNIFLHSFYRNDFEFNPKDKDGKPLKLGKGGMKLKKEALKKYAEDTLKLVDMPDIFVKLLRAKAHKWRKYRIEFTLAVHKESGASTISIVHPRDHFNRKLGYKISKGRLERVLSGKLPYVKIFKNKNTGKTLKISWIPSYIITTDEDHWSKLRETSLVEEV